MTTGEQLKLRDIFMLDVSSMVMPCRLQSMQATLLVLQHYGYAPLIQYAGDGTLVPAGFADFMGVYFFVPMVAFLLKCNIQQAIIVFFGSLYTLAALSGSIGFILYFKRILSKLLGCFICISLCFFAPQHTLITYSVAMIVAIGLIPIFLCLERSGYFKAFLIFMFIAGVLMGFGHSIRPGAILPSLFFFLIMICLSKTYSLRKKALICLSLILGIVLSLSNFYFVVHQRNAFLKVHNSSLNLKTETKSRMWHTVYIGLGYGHSNNPYGISYDDRVAIRKAQSVDPNVSFTSIKYEQILKKASLDFIKKHPKFYIISQLAKIGGGLKKILAFVPVDHLHGVQRIILWLGWLLGIINIARRRYIRLHIAFLVAIAVGFLPTLIAIPVLGYLLPSIVLADLYAYIMLGLSLDRVCAG
jgi:hypothetical protein